MPPAGRRQAGRRVPQPDPEVLAALEAALADTPGIKRRPMFGCPAFFAGRRMFACVYGDQVGLKLPAARVEELLQSGYVPFRPIGKPPMREWAAAPRELALSFADEPAVVLEALRFIVRGE